MHKVDYTDRFKFENGKITRIIKANWKNRHLDVYKENEEGKAWCKNLYEGFYGYFVSFPNEVTSLYHKGGNEFIQKRESYGKCYKPLGLFCVNKAEKKDIDFFLNIDPSFKYTVNKYLEKIGGEYGISNQKLFELFKIWKKNPEIEIVINSKNAKSLIFNKSFYKLSMEKKKEVLRFMKTHNQYRYSLQDYQKIKKYNIKESDIKGYISFVHEFKLSDYKVYTYLKNRNLCDYSSVHLYKDYIKMAEEVGHDIKNDYWKFPKDLRTFHNKVLEELNNIRRAEEEERAERRRLEKIQDEKIKKNETSYYQRAVKKYLSYNTENYKGYKIFIPYTMAEWKEQAESLNQCIVRLNYRKHVITKKSVLIFIHKDNKPFATVEVFKDNRIGQFYKDETDRDNCLPSAEERKVFENWLKDKTFESLSA